MADDLLVFVPLRVEAAVVPKRAGWTVLRTGMGRQRARIAAARGLAVDARAVAVVGLCAAVSHELRAGDVVCASELQGDGVTRDVPGADIVATAMRRHGLRTHVGAIVSVDRIARRDERRALGGVLAVDMESAWLAQAAEGRPLTVVRVVVETADRNLLDVRTPAAGIRALRNLRRVALALPEPTDAYLAGDGDREPQEVSA